jgi:2-desacetyl-2-hydroxyethyl bacteriochlorophyllide A dehydrogenase
VGPRLKALVLEAPRHLVLREVPEPEPITGEVLVQVEWSGVCGTDLHGYAQGAPLRQTPVIMGHEFSGIVVDTGQRVVINPRVVCGTCAHCLAGQTQLCQSAITLGVHRAGGFAERVAVPEANCIAIPDGLDGTVAALTEALAVGLHGTKVLETHLRLEGLALAVIGAGVVGLGLALVAQEQGARVTVVDVAPERRLQAQRHGLERVAETLDGNWPAIVEAVGSASARRASVDHLAEGGVALWIGLDTAPAEVDVPHLVRGERAIVTSYCYTSAELQDAVGLCTQFSADELEIVPMTEGRTVFERPGGGAAGGRARTVFAVGRG